MTARLIVLIIGGYGTFGSRVAELLQIDPRLTLIIAGRSLQKATDFCQAHPNASATLMPAAFDRHGDAAPQLRAWSVDYVIDASGPFQNYGDHPYRIVQACISQSINYIDLADDSQFVIGIAQFDNAAQRAGCSILSGASSFPALSAAAVRDLAIGMAQVKSICAGVAPSPYAPVGENVIRAITSYAGQPISLKRSSKIVFPFTEQKRFTIAPPGYLPLPSILFSLVDVPDLHIFPTSWPDLDIVWTGAGPLPAFLHRILIALAWLVRIRMLPTLTPLARLMHTVMKYRRWGEDRGGMFVEITGADRSGQSRKRSWHLVAEGQHGPFIPAMAAAALINRTLDHQPPQPGARATIRDLDLSDYQPFFTKHSIRTGVRDHDRKNNAGLYQHLLGSAYSLLPSALQAMHNQPTTASGRASIRRGKNPLAWLIASMVGFPKAGENMPVQVRFEVTPNGERWTRTFGGQSFSSYQFAGQGRNAGLLCERFGPMIFAMALVTHDNGFALVLRRWSLGRLSLPLWLGPRSRSQEIVENGRFCFDIELSHPCTGLIVAYRGQLDPPS
jgi:hypothetical protein